MDGDFDGQEGVVGGQEGALEGQEPVAKPNPLEPGGQRFEQVYGKMKQLETQIQQYKELGDGGAVREQLARLKQYEKAIEDYRKQQSMTTDERSEQERINRLQKELLKVMPNLQRLDKVDELEKQLAEYRTSAEEQRVTANLEKASVRFTDTLKANKIDTKYQSKIEEYIVSQMTSDEKKEFVKGNFEIAETIFKKELEDGLFSAMRAKPHLQTPALRNTPGGTPPAGKTKTPMSMKEADDAAWNRMSGSE